MPNQAFSEILQFTISYQYQSRRPSQHSEFKNTSQCCQQLDYKFRLEYFLISCATIFLLSNVSRNLGLVIMPKSHHLLCYKIQATATNTVYSASCHGIRAGVCIKQLAKLCPGFCILEHLTLLVIPVNRTRVVYPGE